MRAPRYDLITETTGMPLTPEAASMMYTRYELAARLAAGKRVLEIGCGAALGFGLMGESSKLVVGGDYSPELLRAAKAHYRSRFPFIRLSADRLPFRNDSFDLVLCYEMSYYLPDAGKAFGEIDRVLAPGGTLLFVNANPERPDFIRSPHSTHYHTGDEFRAALSRLGMSVEVCGAFPLAQPDGRPVGGLKQQVLMYARKTLEAMHLVPRTLEGRARLKRLIYRNLHKLPAELPRDFARIADRQVVAPGPVRGWKVIYVTATKAA